VKHQPKVYVIDDDLAVLQSLQALLIAHGYEVHCFTDAEQFKAQYHPTQVGCVLIDLLIPGLGGSEILKFLQKTGSLLSVVVTSGPIETDAFQEEHDESFLLLEKPYEVSTLLTMIADGVAGSFRRRAERHRTDGGE